MPRTASDGIEVARTASLIGRCNEMADSTNMSLVRQLIIDNDGGLDDALVRTALLRMNLLVWFECDGISSHITYCIVMYTSRRWF